MEQGKEKYVVKVPFRLSKSFMLLALELNILLRRVSNTFAMKSSGEYLAYIILIPAFLN